MAITDLNGVLAGMQPLQVFYKVASPTLVGGRPQSLWTLGGIPSAGTLNGTLNGATYSSTSALVPGQIPHTDPAGGVNSYLARWQCLANGSPGVIMLCDRLWDNQLATSNTSLQSITFPGMPSRDNAGTANGDGILAAIEISGATSATAAALTSFTYTNQSNLGSRAGTLIDAPTAVAASAGQFYRIALQTSDTGIRSVDSIQFSTAWTSGTVNLVAYRVLAVLEAPLSLTPNLVDPVTSGFPQIYNGVVPFVVFIPSLTTATALIGSYIESQG